jgi:hypothetical protein
VSIAFGTRHDECRSAAVIGADEAAAAFCTRSDPRARLRAFQRGVIDFALVSMPQSRREALATGAAFTS